mgnify:CR=1 FL=1
MKEYESVILTSFQDDAKVALEELLSKSVAFQARTWELLAEEPETSLEGQKNRLHDLMMDMRQMERILKELVIFETDMLEQWERFKKTIGLVADVERTNDSFVRESKKDPVFETILPLTACVQGRLDVNECRLTERLTSEQIESLTRYLKKKYQKVCDVFE